ncbi:MAG: hypothetical protein K0B10_03225 [Vicingaceae bacterium]|nr:hypothetical protein [Vicingaceae bacterium]
MNFKKVIAAFLLTILVSTFSFSYFSIPSNQFIEINEEENRHSGKLITFSVQEYVAESTNSNIFLFTTDVNHQNNTFQFLPPTRKVIAPPPELV